MCGRSWVFLVVVFVFTLTRIAISLPQDESIQHKEELFPTAEFPPDTGEDEDRFPQDNDSSRLQALQAELEEHLNLGEGAIPGEPEQDYPVFSKVPQTSFSCAGKHAPGYYADIEARCQAFHICDSGGAKHSFLCPGGSVFNQKYLVCDWWYGFTCQEAPNLFEDQREIYKLFQKESNNHKLLSHHVDIPSNEPFRTDNEQNNYVFLQNEVFQEAESGNPVQSKLENYRGHDSNNKEKKQGDSLKDTKEVVKSQTSLLVSNRNSNVDNTNNRENVPSDTNHIRKQIKSVVRKKQHNQGIDLKGFSSESRPNSNGEVIVQLDNDHKVGTSPTRSIEYYQSNLNQPVS